MIETIVDRSYFVELFLHHLHSSDPGHSGWYIVRTLVHHYQKYWYKHTRLYRICTRNEIPNKKNRHH